MNLAKQIIADRIQICQQPKKRRRCEPTCQEHLFTLTRTHRGTHQLDTLVNFCPKIHRGNQPQETTHPEFNPDRLYYTSAFVLGVDKKIVEQTRQQQLAQHTRIVKETNQKNCKVLFPKPSSKHCICSVCKVSYDNHYYAHILSDYHKERIRSSIYNDYIQQLTANFEQLHPPKDFPLSSPFQLPNHIPGKAQDETNTTETPNDQEAQPFDAYDKLTAFQDEPVRVKRGKKSSKKSRKNEPATKIANKIQQGELTFHKITSFTLKNGQVIEQSNQDAITVCNRIDTNCLQQSKNHQKKEKRRKKIEKKGSRPRGRPRKHPHPIIKPNIDKREDIQSSGQSNAIQSKQSGLQMRLRQNEQPGTNKRLTITSLNLMNQQQSSSSNVSESKQCKDGLQQTDQLNQLSSELKNAISPNQWIQLQLNSAQQELVEEEELQLELMSFIQPTEIQKVLLSQQQADIGMPHQIKQGISELNAPSSPSPKQSYSWEKLGISLQQFIRIKLSAVFNQQQKGTIKASDQCKVIPLPNIRYDNCPQPEKKIEINISNKPLYQIKGQSNVIEIQSDSIDESSSQEEFEQKADWKKYFDSAFIKEQQPVKSEQNNSRKRKMKFNGAIQSPWKKIIVSNGIVKNCIEPQPPLDSDSDIDSDEADLSDWQQQIRNVTFHRGAIQKSPKQEGLIRTCQTNNLQFPGLLARKNNSQDQQKQQKYFYRFN